MVNHSQNDENSTQSFHRYFIQPRGLALPGLGDGWRLLVRGGMEPGDSGGEWYLRCSADREDRWEIHGENSHGKSWHLGLGVATALFQETPFFWPGVGKSWDIDVPRFFGIGFTSPKQIYLLEMKYIPNGRVMWTIRTWEPTPGDQPGEDRLAIPDAPCMECLPSHRIRVWYIC